MCPDFLRIDIDFCPKTLKKRKKNDFSGKFSLKKTFFEKLSFSL